MCERTEREAVTILARSIVGWVGAGGDVDDYDDDIALTILLQNGIRPSGLSADLDWLLIRAQRRAMQGRLD